MSRPRVSVLFLLLVACISRLRADEHPNIGRGFEAEKAFLVGEIDNVNTFSGNLVLTIPIGGSFPAGGGLSYGLTLVYNSNLWDFQERADELTMETYSQGWPNRTSNNAGLGWLLSLGRLIPKEETWNETGRWIYQSSDGAEHILYDTLHVGDDDEPGDISMSQSVSYTRDGTYLRMRVINAGLREVDFPNGQIHRFRFDNRLVQIRDRFNNALNITYAPLLWTLTDTQGRTHKVHLKQLVQSWDSGTLSETIEVVDKVELSTFNPDPNVFATYTFNYAPATIARGCPDNDPMLGNTFQAQFLTSVTLPDGSSYQMPLSDYLTNVPHGGSVCRSSGAIKGLTLPTLGRLEYTYQDYDLPNASGKIHRSWSPGVLTRQTKDASGTVLGEWTYDSILAPGNQELKTIVIDPLGHRTERYFMPAPGSYQYSLPFNPNVTDGAGRFLSTRTYEGSSVNPVRSTFVRYDADQRFVSGDDLTELMAANRREASSRTVFHDDGNRFADLNRSNFDGLGHYRTEETGGNFNAGDVRSTFTTFNPERGTYQFDPVTNLPLPGHDFTQWPHPYWVLETFKSRQVTEGTSELTKYCFDDDTGFLLRQRRLKNGTAESNHDVVAVFTPDGAGNLQTEQFFGGDPQIVEFNTPLCTMGLPAPAYQINHTYQSGVRATSQYSGADFLSLNQTIDARTGLPSSSRDVSGLQTDYLYDTMSRLTWVRPAVGHGSWTEYVYNRAVSSFSLANVLVRRRPNNAPTGTVLARNQIFFDALGRVWQEKQFLPSNDWNARETLYDAAGNKKSVSELQLGTPTKKTQFLDYDPFGRATTIRPPDGAQHDVTFNYFGVRVVERKVKIATSQGGEQIATTTETYDRQGRLAKVSEPSAEDGSLVTTTYSYDVGNRLKQVQTPAVAGGSPVTQNRFFTYDNLGFLRTETHPEKGASGNGSVTYPSYDARGNLRQKIDGPNNLTFVYDSAERLTEVKENTNPARTLKSFTYHPGPNANYTDPITGAVCFDIRKGKLTQQSRFNYVNLSGSDFSVELREGMTYCGRDGRLSRRSLENWVRTAGNPNPSAPSESFFLPNITYDALGNVTSLDYPRCTHAACSGAVSPRNVTFSYDEGLLVSVGIPGNAGHYASSITYHPNLMVNQVIHGNSLRDTHTIDPNAMRRPAAITVTTPANEVRWTTGTYGYDGAGNVTDIGQSKFTYDLVSRLKQADLFVENAGSNLIFADGFESGTMDCWDPGSCPPANGQMLTQTYTFDPFGNLQAIGVNNARNTPTSSSTNRLTQGGYDAAGNLTSWNGNTYKYDPFNLMWNYRTLTPGDEWLYLHTADDERAWSYQVGDISRWTLRGPSNQVLREYSTVGGWHVESDYIHRDDSLLAAETSQGIRHFHLDHLGTPRLISNSLGQQAAYHVYYPFGEEATDFDQDAIRAKFTGHERDLGNLAGPGDDLDYMHARHCSPVTGRFLSPDRMDGKPSQPQSWNRFTYVLGNPIRLVDSNGLEPILPEIKQFLEAFFGTNLDHIETKGGLQGQIVSMLARGFPAVTVGSTIYLSFDADSEYSNGTLYGVSTMAHEVMHTFDYNARGTAGFLLSYAAEGAINLHQKQSLDEAYNNISLELRGKEAEALVRTFLEKNPDIRTKLANGEALTQEELDRVSGYAIDLVSKGKLRHGFQFIDGRLTYVRLTVK